MDTVALDLPALENQRRQHIEAEPMLRFFAFEHLPEALRDTSSAFCALAVALVMELPRNPERTVALRKLLESKDCAVRAML